MSKQLNSRNKYERIIVPDCELKVSPFCIYTTRNKYKNAQLIEIATMLD